MCATKNVNKRGKLPLSGNIVAVECPQGHVIARVDVILTVAATEYGMLGWCPVCWKEGQKSMIDEREQGYCREAT